MITMRSNAVGRVGELLTCFHLEKIGISTVIVNLPGIDIIGITDAGASFTIEVKSRTGVTDGTYHFRNKSKSVPDWIAYVALDSQLMLFESGTSMVKSRYIPAEQFTPENMTEALAKVREAYH